LVDTQVSSEDRRFS